MAASAGPYRINIPETVRGIGAYAAVDDALFFVPSPLLAELVDSQLSRPTAADSYGHARACVYRACVIASCILAESAGDESTFEFPERLVRLASVRAAIAHRSELSRESERRGLRGGLPKGNVFVKACAAASIGELSAAAPSAVGLASALGCEDVLVTPADVAHDMPRDDGSTVRVRPLEIIPGLGSYVSVGERVYYAPTRLVGELVPLDSSASLRDHGLRTLAVFAQLPRLYGERATAQADVPSFRRIACFRTEAEAVAHRTRLAAMFLLPASPVLTRPHEVAMHYGAARDCDRPWIQHYLAAPETVLAN